MTRRKPAYLVVRIATMLFAGLFMNFEATAQTDPGPRPGPPGAGSFYPTLSAQEQAFFNQALKRFQEIDSVSGTIAGEPGSGLGPTFNGNSCAQCHSQPAVGGSSPGLISPQNPVPNPQVVLATLAGATNTVPSFIVPTGPVLEARFIKNSTGTSDGSVHDLYTIAGRSDASGCTLAQPPFAAELAASNVIFRQPTPLFGLGLVEVTPDATLEANLTSTASARAELKIGGEFNHNANDNTITRFGWKAQDKSLLLFSGEANNVEMGVSNELFPNERNMVPGCAFNAEPEDSTHIVNRDRSSPNFGTTIGTASEMSADIIVFAAFSRLSAPPIPAAATSSTEAGSRLFASIGCSLCHSPSLTTGRSIFRGMSNVTYHPYSDFALHRMGVTLSDGVNQGNAGPSQFRTAPLWGIGQRLFFLHDGRTSDLIQAIESHSSSGSEANLVVKKYNGLSAAQQQDILNFLRSL
jgi:CxxC motif-containing protein (DUF1111 family)